MSAIGNSWRDRREKKIRKSENRKDEKSTSPFSHTASSEINHNIHTT